MASILLIDDEPDIRDSVGKVLGRSGHMVHTSASAEEGLQYLEHNQIDVVIADLIMPGLNGVEAIKRIRTMYAEAKIIAISGGGNFGSAAYQPDAIATTAYLEAAAIAGADIVLTKPFELRDLTSAVDAILSEEGT